MNIVPAVLQLRPDWVLQMAPLQPSAGLLDSLLAWQPPHSAEPLSDNYQPLSDDALTQVLSCLRCLLFTI